LDTGKFKPKLKIALIFMPINEIRPPVSSTGVAVSVDLIADELVRHLAQSHDVVAYCARGKDQQKVDQFDGVEYRRMSTWLDLRLSHHQKIMQLIGPARS
jgi:hypothetical protein